MMLVALQGQAQGYHYDVNNDGAITIADVVSLVNKLLGKPDEGDTSNNEQRKLILRVSENPLISPNGAKANKRLAPAIFTNTLPKFYISMMYYSHYFEEWCNADDETYSMNNEIYPPGQYQNKGTWPEKSVVGDDEIVTVFGYYTYEDRYDLDKKENGYFFLNQGDPYLQVVTEESSDDQRDVLVAKNADTWNNCKGVVNLVFNHVCAALQFSLMKTMSLADYTVEVKEVKLHNIYKVGNYYLLTDKWEVVEDDNYYTNFTLSAYKEGEMNAITVGTEETLLGKKESPYLFLIPQTITGMAKGTAITDADQAKSAYLEIKCKIYDGNNIFKVGSAIDYGSVYLPFSTTLTAGHIHPFTISIGTAIRDAQGNKIFN